MGYKKVAKIFLIGEGLLFLYSGFFFMYHILSGTVPHGHAPTIPFTSIPIFYYPSVPFLIGGPLFLALGFPDKVANALSSRSWIPLRVLIILIALGFYSMQFVGSSSPMQYVWGPFFAAAVILGPILLGIGLSENLSNKLGIRSNIRKALVALSTILFVVAFILVHSSPSALASLLSPAGVPGLYFIGGLGVHVIFEHTAGSMLLLTLAVKPNILVNKVKKAISNVIG
ncbi:MAG: hypothetical protein TQ35_0009605 [Candidatus Aramenus sulfurataquae]|jgi:hypothetical protein|uniref:Uncharacterized protein n=2 Tax=Candidatus Aramenus sulfurataquae TaxID=1326980 RepID=A0A0F2LLH3_9CREN